MTLNTDETVGRTRKNGVSRRVLLGGAVAGLAVLAAPMINRGEYAAFAGSMTKYSRRALRLVERALVIDMLAPVTINEEDWKRWLSGPDGLTEAEVQALKSCGITGFHHAIGLDGPTVFSDALTYCASVNAFIGRYSDHFTLVCRARDLVHAKERGKAGVILGVQNADHFRTADDVSLFYELGQRCAQLTYNSQNFIGSGSTDRIDSGVSDFGAAVIEKMNAVGMLVDVSHCANKTTLDAIEISTKPIAITHSNCHALNNHPRLKTDEVIRKLAAKGGVMGITGVRMFVTGQEPTTIDHIVDHIDHIVKLVGIDHVGIGSDTDINGYDDLPEEAQKTLRAAYKSSYAFREKLDIEGFDHPKKIFDLTEVLIRRGYSDANIEAILGGNFRRLLEEVWG